MCGDVYAHCMFLSTLNSVWHVLGIVFYSCWIVGMFSVQAGEDCMQRKEHAGPAASGPFHHRTARSLLYWAVDRWLRLSESSQVRELHIHTRLVRYRTHTHTHAHWQNMVSFTPHMCLWRASHKALNQDCVQVWWWMNVLLSGSCWVLTCAQTFRFFWHELGIHKFYSVTFTVSMENKIYKTYIYAFLLYYKGGCIQYQKCMLCFRIKVICYAVSSPDIKLCADVKLIQCSCHAAL